jgi:dienelactone hydrolase
MNLHANGKEKRSRWRERAGWRLAASLALLAMAAMPLRSQMSDATAKQLRAGIRAALFVPEPLPALDAKNYGSFSPEPGVVAERVTYATEYGLRVPAIVYRPEKIHGRIPGIVVVNGHGADKTSWYSWYTGVEYARAGALVVTYDPIGEGERNDDHKDATGEHDKLINVPGVPQRMGGQMLTDVMQAVSYLSSRPEVDAKRIAVMGFSMGSFVVSIAGAVDDRIHAVLLTGGGDLDGPGGYWDASHAVMCQSGPYHALEFLGDRPAVLVALQAKRGPTFIFNGTNDTVVAIPQHGPDFFDGLRKRTIAELGSDKNVFTTYFDQGASHRPAWVTKIAAQWLAENLHFANWKSRQIASLPTIRIGDWAAKNGVEFNKSAQREDRDAGLVAIDVQVPKLTPEQLSVLPMAEWEKQREDFVYSTWARDAIADAERGKDSEVSGVSGASGVRVQIDPEIASKAGQMTVPLTPVTTDLPQSQSVPSCEALPGGGRPGAHVPSYVEEPIEQLKRMVPGLSGIRIEAVENAKAGASAIPAQDKTASILNRTSAVIADLFHRMPNLIAKEEVKQPTDTVLKNDLPMKPSQGLSLSPVQQGLPITHFRTSVYTYRIVHKQTPAGGDALDEFRTDAHDQPIDDSAHNAQRPFSVGFATTWLFFLPGNLQESHFRYVGVQKVGNRETYAVAFAQIPERDALHAVIESSYGHCSTLIQGVAWIDQSKFQIVRMQTDLLTPLPGIQLNQLRSMLEYGAVKIRALNLTLWLPTEVETQWQTAYRAGEETHEYSHYRLFESTAKILP